MTVNPLGSERCMSSSISQQLQAALAHHQAGRLREAEAIYRTILAEQPEDPNALYLLGVLALQAGQNEAAHDLLKKAIAVSPANADAHNMCGEACRALGQPDEAIRSYQEALRLNPEFAGAINNLGNVYMELGRHEAAAAEYARAIALAPGFAMSHDNLGLAMKALGRPEEALPHFERALSIAPDYPGAHNNLGNTLREIGRTDEAIARYRRVIELDPRFAEAHNNLGTALKDIGNLDEAAAEYEKALALRPGFAMAHNNLGLLYDETARPYDAMACYERAIAIDPDYADARNNLGNVLFQLGRPDEAAAEYRKAIAIRPSFAEAYRHLTNVRPDPEIIGSILEQLDRPDLPSDDTMHFHYALARIAEHQREHGEAFRHFQTANRLRRRALDYDPDEHARLIDRLIETFSPALRERTRDWGSDSEVPVFIVGMPRSGTTLVEQIVSSHPRVHGAGELPILANLAMGLAGYPESLLERGPALAADWSDRYLAVLRGHSDSADRITDKAPSNFLRIGLIRLLFPRARIVHCRRNPLDTCLSNYFNYFVVGNEFSYDLEELGHYYQCYERLMNHWRESFAAGFLEVDYQDLVRDQEATSRKLIDYLGLEWDPACLAFHQNRRAVKTASSMQVREPIYGRSVDRWRNYEEQLSPLISLLRR